MSWLKPRPTKILKFSHTLRRSGSRFGRYQSLTLDALVGLVGPFQLHRVGADFLGFPGADVANFTVGVVIPALARNWIGDGFAQLVGAGRGERINRLKAARAPGAAREGHGGIENLTVDVVVIAAERGAGAGPALDDLHAWGKK